MSGLRERILGAKTLKPKKLDLPEWPELDGAVWVRKLTARQMMDAVKRFGPPEDGQERDVVTFFPEVAAYFMCDENNALLFGPEDLDALSELSIDALQAIVEAGMAHNGMSVEAQEGLGKNSQPTPASDSPTG